MTREDLVARLMDSPAGMEWWAAPAGTGQWGDRLPCCHSDHPDQYTHQVQAPPAPWELLVCRRGVVHLRHLPGGPDPGDRVERQALREALAAVEALVFAHPTDQEERDMEDRWHVTQQGRVNITNLTPGAVNVVGDLHFGPDDDQDDDDQD